MVPGKRKTDRGIYLVITNNFLFRQFLQLWNPLACSYVEEPIAPVTGERF